MDLCFQNIKRLCLTFTSVKKQSRTCISQLDGLGEFGLFQNILKIALTPKNKSQKEQMFSLFVDSEGDGEMKDILFIKTFGTNKCECGSNKSVVGIISKNKKTVREYHDKAMIHSDKAIEEYRKAFEYEQKAAMMLLNEKEMEPTRSILFRSAACLAYKSGYYSFSVKMAQEGLNGMPPFEIREELKDVLDNALKEVL